MTFKKPYDILELGKQKGEIKMIDMRAFTEEYRKQYDFIYEVEGKGGQVAGSREALDYFENDKTEEETEILVRFANHRGDFVSSDREVIAFMFTIDKFL